MITSLEYAYRAVTSQVLSSITFHNPCQSQFLCLSTAGLGTFCRFAVIESPVLWWLLYYSTDADSLPPYFSLSVFSYDKYKLRVPANNKNGV